MTYIKELDSRIDGKMAFTPEEVADGKLTKFIEVLRECDAEIHIWTDGYCWIVEYLEDSTTADGINFHPVDYNEDCIVKSKYVNWELMEADGNE